MKDNAYRKFTTTGVATALSAIAASATCGVFTLGMVCWWVGPRGAIAGGIAGALMAGTVSLGTQAAAAQGLRAPPLGMNEACARNASFVFEPAVVSVLIVIYFIIPQHLAVTGYVLLDEDQYNIVQWFFTFNC